MGNRQEVVVRRHFDVIVARSRVRDLARRLGMGTTGQARISLATSSVARILGLGCPHHGQIVFEELDDGERKGVRVICTTSNGASDEPTSRAFADPRYMTDELTVERLPSNEIQVTLVKWSR